jgi:antitoxin component YwqK of YwqJK toxin-antitoxin module
MLVAPPNVLVARKRGSLETEGIQNYPEKISFVKNTFWILVTIISFLFIVAFTGCAKPVPLPHAASAATSIDIEKAKPISQDILDFNSLRRVAAITEVGKRWQIVPTRLFIMDGPILVVLIDEQRNPVKVIERNGLGWGMSVSRITEYTISGGNLSGKAATWLGEPPILFTTQTYKDNVLDGPMTYYDMEGRVISVCEFRQGAPWTGRSLYRDSFDRLSADASYREGKSDGQEWTYSINGQPNQLQTFRMGILHGLRQRYRKGGCLYLEETYDNGILRSYRMWHDNGQIESSAEYDIDGKPNGKHCMWDFDGKLILEENYLHGKYDGWRWEKGHGDELLWRNNEIVGRRKANFDSLSTSNLKGTN